MLKDPATVIIIGLESQRKKTILLEPSWELDLEMKGQLTKSYIVKVATVAKSSP